MTVHEPRIKARSILFPTVAVLPDGRRLDPVKAIVGLDTLFVYTGAGEPALRARIEDLRGSAREGFDVVTTQGTVVLRKSSDCGCGNSLKHWLPPQGVSMVAVR